MRPNASEGFVEDGVIRIKDNASLTEHSKAYVIVAKATGGGTAHIRSPRLVHPEQAKDFRKQIVVAPPRLIPHS